MTVQVRYLGHLGNNLFEYALGRIIAEGLGQELVCLPAQDTPGWSQVEAMSGIRDRLTAHWRDFLDAPQEMIGAKFERPSIRYVYGEVPGWSGHGINLDYILRHGHGHGHKIILHGYFQRIQYYHPHRERIRSWFRFCESRPMFEVRPDDVVVHLRQSPDMYILNRAISLNYYRDILSGLSFGRVLVCGLGLNDQVKAALMPFNPVYPDLSAIETPKLLARARRIVLANSTFSWWGAYLSDASEVYYPRVVRGFWGADWAEVDLGFLDDKNSARVSQIWTGASLA
jgi:hypothetical protein